MHGAHHSACFGCIQEQSRCKDHSKSSEAYGRALQFGETECTVIGKSRRLRKEGNARIDMVLAVRPGLAKIIETVRN